jgi:hypothetical protein
MLWGFVAAFNKFSEDHKPQHIVFAPALINWLAYSDYLEGTETDALVMAQSPLFYCAKTLEARTLPALVPKRDQFTHVHFPTALETEGVANII